jgi:AcrR family transcriptional regulator
VKEPDAEGARRLPPGPHGIPRELVARNQRERLIAAMAEVCGEGGYATATVAEVARRAGVSTASFYRQFKDRRECMLASFEELFGRLLGEIERACAGEGAAAEKVRAGIGVAASLLASDPPTARLLTVEIAAVGAEGVRLQHEAIERLALRLREASDPGPPDSPAFPSPEWAAVAAMVALVAKRVAAGESPDSTELEAICSSRRI